MSAVPAGLIADRDQYVAAAFDAPDFALHHPKLRRINQIVRGIDCDEGRLDRLKSRLRIVLARRFKLIDEIIRVKPGDRRLETIQVEFLCGLTSESLFLPLQRRAAC